MPRQKPRQPAERLRVWDYSQPQRPAERVRVLARLQAWEPVPRQEPSHQPELGYPQAQVRASRRA